MLPQIKNLRLTALRSGLYRQGQGYLRTSDNRYCCLGVLCDVYQKQTGNGRWDTNSHGTLIFRQDGEGDGKVLPKFVQEWANIDDQNPNVKQPLPEGDSNVVSLAELNDDGEEFDQIADYIEKHL